MNLQSIFQKLYPEGFYGGECGTFAHNLIDFPPVGNSYNEKKRAVLNYGIPQELLRGNFRVGDVVITSEGTWLGFGNGHVCVVNSLTNNEIQLTESNFNKDGKVHHTRRLAKDNPKIFGVIRGAFKFPYVLLTPVQLTVDILFNNTQLWPSLLNKMAALQNWFWQASNHQLQIIVDYKMVNVSDWDYEVNPMFNTETMQKKFYDTNVLPKSDAQAVVMVINPKDWHKPSSAFTDAYGYCWTDNNRIKAYVVCNEFDISKTYFGKNAFVDYVCHEVIHGLYALAVKDKFAYGTDNTHLHYYQKEFERVFDDLDFRSLNLSVL